MPYNVICLACTVAALAFGPIHNITTKSLELVQPGQEEKGLLGKLLDKLRALLRKKEVVTAPKKEDKEEGEEDAEDAEDAEEEVKDEEEENDGGCDVRTEAD